MLQDFTVSVLDDVKEFANIFLNIIADRINAANHQYFKDLRRGCMNLSLRRLNHHAAVRLQASHPT